MNRSTSLVIPESLYTTLIRHLFPGDRDEHAAVVAAGLATDGCRTRLLARELFIAEEGRDYRYSSRGYKALQASFIHQCITYCRDQRLVYLAIHNHGGSGSVGFSAIDYESHERGYPALLDIAAGMPVGALVFAEGAVELDLWLPDGNRSALRETRIVGSRLERLYPDSRWGHDFFDHSTAPDALYDRQVLLFGMAGQRLLQAAKVAIVGLGGIGSLVSEYLARLGVGEIVLIDPDYLESSNFSRVVGATAEDLPKGKDARGTRKVDIAARIARAAQPHMQITLIHDDFSRGSVARQVLDCDYIFLAADTMRARLVFNAIVNQYFIPGVQLGSKIIANSQSGMIEAAYSVIRNVVPGSGCLLCNQLIDGAKLAEEWKTDQERLDQRYGTDVPNPSVITMNAVSAAHATNDFLFYFTGLNRQGFRTPYLRFDHLAGTTKFEEPRRSLACNECSLSPASRFGMGDARQLPCTD
jgi:ThiF family